MTVDREIEMEKKRRWMASDPEGYFKDAYKRARRKEDEEIWSALSALFSKLRHIFVQLR